MAGLLIRLSKVRACHDHTDSCLLLRNTFVTRPAAERPRSPSRGLIECAVPCVQRVWVVFDHEFSETEFTVIVIPVRIVGKTSIWTMT